MSATNGNGRTNGAALVAAPTVDLAALVPQTLPEAPVSLNVRLGYRGRDIQLTLRGTEDAVVFARLDAVLSYLDALGEVQAAAPQNTAPAATTAAETAPTCPAHGTPMKASKFGGYYCTAKVAPDDGTGRPVYCRHKVQGAAP